MKSRKIMFVVSMLVCVAAFSPLAAQADWVTCTVDQAGPFGTNETVRVAEPAHLEQEVSPSVFIFVAGYQFFLGLSTFVSFAGRP
jgi:hypothetical protein